MQNKCVIILDRENVGYYKVAYLDPPKAANLKRVGPYFGHFAQYVESND